MTEEEAWLKGAKAERYYAYRDSIDEENALIFIRYCEKYGPPFEGNIGRFLFNNPDKNGLTSTITCTQILIRHFLHTRYQNKIFAIVEQGLKDGILHPSRYAWFAEVVWENEKYKNTSYPYMNTTVNLVSGVYFRPFVIYSDSLMDVVNSNRTKIGLDSFKYAREQALCSRICRDSGVDSSSYLNIYNYSIFDSFGLGLVK